MTLARGKAFDLYPPWSNGGYQNLISKVFRSSFLGVFFFFIDNIRHLYHSTVHGLQSPSEAIVEVLFNYADITQWAYLTMRENLMDSTQSGCRGLFRAPLWFDGFLRAYVTRAWRRSAVSRKAPSLGCYCQCNSMGFLCRLSARRGTSHQLKQEAAEEVQLCFLSFATAADSQLCVNVHNRESVSQNSISESLNDHGSLPLSMLNVFQGDCDKCWTCNAKAEPSLSLYARLVHR